jgi:hypothetical protein
MYPSRNALATFLSAACPLLLYFYTWLHKRHDFCEKLWNIKWVYRFSLQVLCETVLIVTRIEGDMLNYIGLHVKYRLFFPDFKKVLIFPTDFGKILNIQISWQSVQCEPSCSMWTDRQVDRHDEVNGHFPQICERAWNDWLSNFMAYIFSRAAKLDSYKYLITPLQ